MAITSRYLVTISCDGCSERIPDWHPSALEARAAAYANGWRFPPTLHANGKQSSRSVSDVCPKCIPTWVPVQQIGQKPQSYYTHDADWTT